MSAPAAPIAATAIMDTTDALLHQLDMSSDTKAIHIQRFSEFRFAVTELLSALAGLPDDTDVMEDVDDRLVVTCCGAEVRSRWHTEPEFKHREDCWLVRLRAAAEAVRA